MKRERKNIPADDRGISTYDSTNYSRSNNDDNLLSKGIRKIDSKIEQESKNFEMLLARQMDTENVVTKGIKSQLRNPKSLKEFIAISEILGKPKALSR